MIKANITELSSLTRIETVNLLNRFAIGEPIAYSVNTIFEDLEFMQDNPDLKDKLTGIDFLFV